MRSYFWPSYVVWETTLRCNMRCQHCGSVAGDAREGELDPEEALDLSRQLVAMGTENIILSGGETLMRDDWADIAGCLLELGAQVGIITNGIALDSDQVLATMQQLHQRSGGTFGLGISLDGVEQAHESIRGIKGSFKRTVRAMERARDAGLRVFVLTTVHRQNFDDLPKLRDLIFELEPFAWQFQTVNVYGRMKDRRDWLLTEEQYVGLAEFLAENRRLRPERPRTDPADCVGYFTDMERQLRDSPWAGCQAGIRVLGIESNGNIKGCLSLLDPVFVEGNVRETSLEEIWDGAGAFAYNREFTPEKLEGLCAGCEHGQRCVAGCRGVAHSITGSFHSAPYCLHGFRQRDKIGTDNG